MPVLIVMINTFITFIAITITVIIKLHPNSSNSNTNLAHAVEVGL